MKGFSRFFSVLFLSLFCSFFVRMDVSAGNVSLYNFFPSRTVSLNFQEFPNGYSTVNYSAGSKVFEESVTSRGSISDFHLATFTYDLSSGELSQLAGSSGNSYAFDYLVTCNFDPGVIVSCPTNNLQSFRVSNLRYSITVDGNPVTSGSAGYSSGVFDGFNFGQVVFDVYGDISFSGYVGATQSKVHYFMLDVAFNPTVFLWMYNLGMSNNLPTILNQQTADMNNQFNKVNDSLTNFGGSAAMDASKGQLDGVIGEYDKVEGSLFDSGQAALDQFDPSSAFTFSAGVSASIIALSSLMIEVISAMGEFSILYTVSVVMVFFGMLIGFWRFFK